MTQDMGSTPGAGLYRLVVLSSLVMSARESDAQCSAYHKTTLDQTFKEHLETIDELKQALNSASWRPERDDWTEFDGYYYLFRNDPATFSSAQKECELLLSKSKLAPPPGLVTSWLKTIQAKVPNLSLAGLSIWLGGTYDRRLKSYISMIDGTMFASFVDRPENQRTWNVPAGIDSNSCLVLKIGSNFPNAAEYDIDVVGCDNKNKYICGDVVRHEKSKTSQQQAYLEELEALRTNYLEGNFPYQDNPESESECPAKPIDTPLDFLRFPRQMLRKLIAKSRPDGQRVFDLLGQFVEDSYRLYSLVKTLKKGSVSIDNLYYCLCNMPSEAVTIPPPFTISQVEDMVKQYRTRIEELAETNKAHFDEVLQGKISSLLVSITKLKGELSAIKGRTDHTGDELAAFVASDNRLQSRFESIVTRVASLETKYLDTVKDNAEVQELLGKWKGYINETAYLVEDFLGNHWSFWVSVTGGSTGLLAILTSVLIAARRFRSEVNDSSIEIEMQPLEAGDIIRLDVEEPRPKAVTFSDEPPRYTENPVSSQYFRIEPSPQTKATETEEDKPEPSKAPARPQTPPPPKTKAEVARPPSGKTPLKSLLKRSTSTVSLPEQRVTRSQTRGLQTPILAFRAIPIDPGHLDSDRISTASRSDSDNIPTPSQLNLYDFDQLKNLY